jgi:Ca2+-binding RTX toxin-like protein
MLTLIHEIGHALGMKHPFEGSKLPAGYDGTNYTVMSYTDMPGAYQVAFSETATHYVATPTAVAPSTPMVLDVAAIQSVYGADPNTRVGPTTYAFDQDAGFYRTIYDAGGVDTLDLSGLTRGSNIDLAPGAYSSVAYFSVADQITAASRRFPDAAEFIGDVFKDLGDEAYTWSNNLGIALNTTIENVSGGLGADTITGNSAANLINGGAGDDFIRGLDGDDAVDGAAGADDVNGNVGRDIVRGGDGADFVRGGQGDDTVYGDAGDDVHVNGNLGADLVLGGTGADTVYGGQGADTLLGEEGADLLSGDLGDDALVGGPGADRFAFRAGTGFDWIGDFNSAEGDRVVLAPGTAYTLRDVQGQAVIDLGGGSQLGLAGVNVASMGDWLVMA